MANKRQRPSGTWEYTVKRSGMLPKPLSLTFDTEKEGDAYVARLEQLLDAGILPEEVAGRVDSIMTVDDAIRSYLRRVSVPSSDVSLLNAVLDRLKGVRLTTVDFKWTERWVTGMKRTDNLSPSTIRHYVGALARCLDWTIKTGTPALVTNPLRSLPARYATYTEDDRKAVLAQNLTPKDDEHRDRRLLQTEEIEIRRLLAGEKPKDRQRPFDLPYRPALVFLFELAIESAMRMREIYTLAPPQFDVDKRTAFLDKTKNGSKRAVPLTSVALASYQRYVDTVNCRTEEMQGFTFDCGHLFPWVPEQIRIAADSNQQLRTGRLFEKVTSRLSGQFGRLFDAAGCADLTFHDLRHEATSRLYERTTLTDIQIAKITGHTDPKVLMRYANLRGSDLAARLW